MQFVTKKGVESQVFSGTLKQNEYRVLCVQEPDDHFIGFYGNYGVTFDAIGLNLLRELKQ